MPAIPLPVLACLPAFALLLLALGPAPAEEYRLDAGDALAVAVYGVPDFDRRVTVNVDGEVSLPFLGEVEAAGRSIGELRRAIARGLEEAGAFRAPQLTVEIVEHRPFYIAGDVSRPGAHPWRAGLTVRHAVALAGGYDALRTRAENPLLATPQFEAENETLWIDLVSLQALAEALRAELDERLPDFEPLLAAPLPRATIDDLVALESRELELRREDRALERAHLDRAADNADLAVESLEKAVAEQEASLALQAEAMERTRANAERGIVPTTRLDEERRAMAALRAQLMDAMSRLTVARRDRQEIQRERERAQTVRAQELIRRLTETTAEIERTRAALHAAGERLIYMGALRSQLRGADRGPDLAIVRDGTDGPRRMPAGEGTPIRPGDVVEVVIRPDRLVIAPSH